MVLAVDTRTYRNSYFKMQNVMPRPWRSHQNPPNLRQSRLAAPPMRDLSVPGPIAENLQSVLLLWNILWYLDPVKNAHAFKVPIDPVGVRLKV